MATHIFSLGTRTAQVSTFPSQPETHHVFSCRGLSFKPRQRLIRPQKLAMKCGGPGEEVEAKRKDEMKEDACDGLMVDDGKEDVNQKVELMEMEALMGKDDGKEPMDYKRRAGIFYKSSEVFQANKDQPHHQCTSKK